MRMFLAVLAALALIAAGPPAVPSPSPTPLLGDQLFALGDFDGAAAVYRTAIADRPKDAAPLLGLATVDVARNQLNDATKTLDALVKLAAADKLQPNPKVAVLRALIAARRTEARGDGIAPYRAPAIVPFETDAPLPLLRVDVNGREGRFAIDTTAGNLALDPQFALAAGVARGVAQDVRLGAVLVHDVPVGTPGARGLPTWGTRRADGAIGVRLLARFLATIDYAHGALVLQPRDASAAFEREAAASGAFVAPMVVAGDAAFARGHLNNGPEGWFRVDTALAAGFVPSKTALADSGLPTFTPFLATVVFGGRRVDGVTGIAPGDADPFSGIPFAVRGAVGQDVFRGAALTLDFTAMKLVIQPVS